MGHSSSESSSDSSDSESEYEYNDGSRGVDAHDASRGAGKKVKKNKKGKKDKKDKKSKKSGKHGKKDKKDKKHGSSSHLPQMSSTQKIGAAVAGAALVAGVVGAGYVVYRKKKVKQVMPDGSVREVEVDCHPNDPEGYDVKVPTQQ
eukprot:Awhi_evm1s1395